MLLKALYKYATDRQLLAGLPFQRRTVHLLISLNAEGSPQGGGFHPLTTPVVIKGKSKEEPGLDVYLPRFPGENNGGRAYYLAESFHTVFGVRLAAGETLPREPLDRSDRNPVGAYQHFWQRIAEAFARTSDLRLRALLNFRERYLCARFVSGVRPVSSGGTWALGLGSLVPSDERVVAFDWLRWLPNERARNRDPEWHGLLATGSWVPLKKLNVCGFEVAGVRLHLGAGDLPFSTDDRIWKDWAAAYTREAFADPTEDEDGGNESRETICLVTGSVGEPVARSHKPKILGVPGLASGGYVVSFAKEAPSFSSFGFEMGSNAPVSEEAAAGYALALNELLASNDTSFGVGGVKFCFWSQKQPKAVGLKFSQLAVANPKAVADFLKEPFSGIDMALALAEQFISVALSANSGRVVIREWIQVTLTDAIQNFAAWFRDLEIVSLGGSANEESIGPYSLFRLAAAAVRDSSELDRVSEVITGLYRAALEKLPVPIAFLGPILAEFHSALVTNTEKNPKYPFNQSRFAIIKLILTRTLAEGDLMPNVYLATATPDQAYNLGRLLAIFANLQKKAHDGKLEGPGVVQRYYAAAASSPLTVFPTLFNLHHHHLRKLEQGGPSGVRKSDGFRARIGDVLKRIPQDVDGNPQFKDVLGMKEQARFALGFYQQHAYDRIASQVRNLINVATKARKSGKSVDADVALSQASQLVTENDYPDLTRLVADLTRVPQS